MNYIVYRIVNTINGKCYIGCSKDVESRFYSHKHYLNRNKHKNPHLQNAWNKYGEENFEFEILLKFGNEQEMFAIETELINTTTSIYNIAAGGSGGNTRKNFTREQNEIYSKNRSKSLKQIHLEREIDHNLFSNISDERRNELRKIWSDCKKGLQNINAKYPQRVIQLDKTLDIVKIWDNIYCLDSCFNKKYVAKCCNKVPGYNSHKGFLWEFESDNN